jgi:chromosome segregation ATPase
MDQNNLQTLDDKQLYDLDVRAAIREVDDAIHRVITAQKNFNAAQSRLDALNQNFNASDAEKTATHQAYNGARDELNNAKEDLGKKRKPQAALATNHDRVMNLAKESNVGNFVVNVMEPNGILLRTITINTAEP